MTSPLLVRGGIIECYRPMWKSNFNTKEALQFLDKDGQYAFIAMISLFPTGEYKVYNIGVCESLVLQIYKTVKLGFDTYS